VNSGFKRIRTCFEIKCEESGSIRISEKSPGVRISGDHHNVIVERAATKTQYIKVRLRKHPTFGQILSDDYLCENARSSVATRNAIEISKLATRALAKPGARKGNAKSIRVT
jgi:hypothetical protein